MSNHDESILSEYSIELRSGEKAVYFCDSMTIKGDSVTFIIKGKVSYLLKGIVRVKFLGVVG